MQTINLRYFVKLYVAYMISPNNCLYFTRILFHIELYHRSLLKATEIYYIP